MPVAVTVAEEPVAVAGPVLVRVGVRVVAVCMVVVPVAAAVPVVVVNRRRGYRSRVDEFPRGRPRRFERIGIRVGRLPVGRAAPGPPDGVSQQAGPDQGHQRAAEHAQPAEEHVSGQRGEGCQAQAHDEHAGRVCHRHGGADRHGVAGAATPAGQVGRHDGLPVAGEQRVPGPQDDGEQHGEQPERDGETVGRSDRGEAGVEAGQPGRRPGGVRPGGCAGTGRRLTGHGVEHGVGDAARTVEQVARVVAQFLGHGGRRNVRVVECDAVAPGGDLVPAHPARVGAAGDPHRGPGCGDAHGGVEPALQPAGPQARRAVLVAELCGPHRPGRGPGVLARRQLQPLCRPGALLRRPGGALGLVDGAVRVPVHLRLLLERGDLRSVGDGEDLDAGGADGQAEVVVQGEVPQGVGIGGGCGEAQEQQCA